MLRGVSTFGDIEWGDDNAVAFEVSKTEAMLLSRSTKLWRDKANEEIQVGNRRVQYNRKATRWLGIWIDSRLSFRENATACRTRARKAE